MSHRYGQASAETDFDHICSPGCDTAFQTELGGAAADGAGVRLRHELLRPVLWLNKRQLRETLDVLPPELTRALLGGQRAGLAKSLFSMDTAMRVHDYLYKRSSETQRVRYLLAFAAPLSTIVRAPRSLGLDAADCAALLAGADEAREVMERRPELLHHLGLTGLRPAATRLCGLGAAVLSCRPAPPLAVGLLLADPGTPPPVAADAAVLWAAMRGHRPGLPEAPLPLDRLLELAAEVREGLPTGEEPPPEAPPRGAPHSPAPTEGPADTMTASPAAPPQDAPGLDALAAEITRLRSSFATAADSARGVHDAVAEGRRPDPADLDRLGSLVGDLDRVGSALASITGGPAPTSLTGLDAGLDRARARAARAGVRSRFASLTGPDEIAPVLAEIRSAAADPDADEGVTEHLRALAGLVDTAERTSPFDPALFELAERVRQAVPPAWHPSVMAAMQRQLVLGAPAAAPAKPVGASSPEPDEGPGEPDGAPPPAEPSPAPGTPPPPPAPGPLDGLAELDAALARESAPGPVARDVPGPGPAADPPGSAPERPASGSGAAPEAEAPDPRPEPAAPTARPAPDSRAPTLVRLERRAMELHRFALAGWLNRAAGVPGATAEIRFAAACAEQVYDTTGPMAEAFRVRAEALCADLPDEPADRLLAWAAAIRAALVAPLEAFPLIEQTSAVNSDRPALQVIGEAFRNAAQSGVYLDLSHTGEQLRDADRARQEHGEAVRRAAELRETARSRTISYQAATELWRGMVRPKGQLWDLLDIPAEDDAARLEECRRLVAGLLGSDAIDDLITRQYRESRSGTSGKKRRTIIAGARTALRKYIEEVRDTAHEWVRAVQRTRALGDSRGGLGNTGHGLTELGQVMTEQREQADRELDALAGGDNPLLGAVADGVRRLLDDTHDLLRGRTPEAKGRAVGLTLNRDLLLIPRIRVPLSGEVSDLPTLPELAEVLHGDDPDWAAACDARIGRGDLVGAELVAALVRETDPASADRLVSRIADRVDGARARLRAASEEFQDDVALHWRNGALSEEEARHLRGAAEALLAEPDRRDFDVMAAELEGLRAESGRLRDRRVNERKEEVRREAERSGQVARHVDRLRDYLDDGQVTSADEMLAQLKANREIVRRGAETDHFSAFYPAFPRELERTQGRVRRGDTPVHPVISELLAHLGRGAGGAAPGLATSGHQALFAGLLAARGSDSERATAGEALRQWRTVARSPKSSGNLKSAVEKILLLLGVDGTVPQSPLSSEPQHRGKLLSMSLTRVKLTGDALLPAFGSKMSPSGDELSLCLLWNRPEPRELFDWLRNAPRDRTVLVLYFGLLTHAQRQSLAALARSRPGPVIGVVDDAVVGYLAALAEPSWSTTVRLIAPFTATRPFQATRMIPEEMFYGREEDLGAVMAPSGAHFVYGGRQLGKSVLLAEAGRRLLTQGDRTAVIQRDIYEIGRSELQAEYFWMTLGGKLSEHGIVSAAVPAPSGREEVCDAIRAWSRENPDRRLLLFFDEADEFLNLDAKEHRFANVVALRELMNATEGRVKAVFAGLHKIARFRSYPNQPFANLGEPLGIGPLSSQDAFDLLVRPLRTLGFHLPETLAVSVIAQANNAPAIVQYFGDLLLDRLRRAQPVELPYEVTLEDVKAVRSDTDLDKAFRDRFEWTLDLDLRYKVIAYAVALQTMDARDATVDEKELLAECRDWWPKAFDRCSLDEFGALLEECVDLGVLAESNGDFELRTPHILTLLGGRSKVERELAEAEERYTLPDDSFDPAYYRAYYNGGPRLSPLTAAQVARLGSPGGRIRLIVGSDALHLDLVPKVLEDAISNVRGRCHRVESGRETFEGAVQRARQKDVVLVPLKEDVKAALAQVAAAEAALHEDAGRRPNIVMLARPAHAPLISGALGYPASDAAADALARIDVVELRRFGRSGVGQWRLLDDFTRIANDAFHEQLFEVTGGWPCLVNAVIKDVVGGEQLVPKNALERRAARLREDPGGFLESTGITDHPAVLAAWGEIVRHGSAETQDDLALLLELAEEQSPGLFDADRHGGIGHTGLVNVLRALGALVPGEGGLLSPEPVLLRTYQASRYSAADESRVR